MIVGIGVDVVDLARFERALERSPALKDRLFAQSEQVDGGLPLPLRSLAGRFAAKEALIKALGDSTGVAWHDMRVVKDPLGNPSFELLDSTSRIAAARGITSLHLSMAHDAGLAIAYVIAEST
jgi:holo-[acyl-carrier protein] synthase